MKENEIKDYIINYLNQLQDVIKRMADNSKSCKQYCITIFAGYLALLGSQLTKTNQNIFINIGMLIIIIVFIILDIRYLKFERNFRTIFNDYVYILKNNIKNNNNNFMMIEKLYCFTIDQSNNKKKLPISAILIYGGQIVFIIIQLILLLIDKIN